MFRQGTVVLTLASLLLVSCGGGGSSSTPTTPTTVTVTSVSVTGTANLTSKGQTSQLTATATLSNGTQQSVTASATWQSSNTAVATVSPAGVVTAVGSGEVQITATYQSQSAQVKITVTLPTTAVASLSLVLKVFKPGSTGYQYRWENTYTFKETGGVHGYTVNSFRIDYYDQNGTFLISQTWDAANIALALGSGGRISASQSKDWSVNFSVNIGATRLRADYQATAVDDAGSAMTLQGSQTADVPAAAIG